MYYDIENVIETQNWGDNDKDAFKFATLYLAILGLLWANNINVIYDGFCI